MWLGVGAHIYIYNPGTKELGLDDCKLDVCLHLMRCYLKN